MGAEIGVEYRKTRFGRPVGGEGWQQFGGYQSESTFDDQSFAVLCRKKEIQSIAFTEDGRVSVTRISFDSSGKPFRQVITFMKNAEDFEGLNCLVSRGPFRESFEFRLKETTDEHLRRIQF